MGVVGANCVCIASQRSEILEEGRPCGSVEGGEKVGDGLRKLVLDTGRVDTVCLVRKSLVNVCHELILDVGQTLFVQTACLNSVADQFQTDMAHDFVWWRVAGEKD